MSDLIVHCPTKELWDRVQERAFEPKHRWGYPATPNDCINVTERLHGGPMFYLETGRKIVPAEEYLAGTEPQTKIQKENDMNATVRKVFKKDPLELAEKINEEFGHEFGRDTFFSELFLWDNKAKFIAELERREEERKMKVCK